MALEALEDGAVLAVHGQDPRIVLARRGHDELAGEDEDLLGGQGEVLAGGERGEGGLEPGGADDGDQHEVGLGQLRKGDEAGEAPVKLRASREGTGAFGRGIGRVLKHRHMRHAEIARDLRESGVVRAGGDADQIELVPVRGDDAQGALADGAGGAQEDDALAGAGRWFGHESWRRCRRGAWVASAEGR